MGSKSPIIVSSPDSLDDPHAPHAPHLSPEQLPHTPHLPEQLLHTPHLSPEQQALPLHAYEEQAEQVEAQQEIEEAQHCLFPLHELHEVEAQQFNSRCEMLVEEHTPEQALQVPLDPEQLDPAQELHSFDAEQEEQLDPVQDSSVAEQVPAQELHSFDPEQELQSFDPAQEE